MADFNPWAVGASLLGSYLQGQSVQNVGQGLANVAQDVKFKPFGTTTSFGTSGFKYDDKGNLTGAAYALAPGLQEQLNTLAGAAPGMLSQFTGAPAATAPMSAGAQTAMGLGQQYLGASPQEQAQKWYQDQQDVLAASRAADLAKVRSNINATGRTGFAIGGDAGMAASNPELQAYYNSIAQQNTDLASRATQAGMDYAKFGTGMLGMGGEMLKNVYGTQQAAFAPYQTAMEGAQSLENLGKSAFDMSTALGSQNMTGAGNAFSAMAYTAPYASYSPWGSMLSGAGQALSNYKWGD